MCALPNQHETGKRVPKKTSAIRKAAVLGIISVWGRGGIMEMLLLKNTDVPVC